MYFIALIYTTPNGDREYLPFVVPPADIKVRFGDEYQDVSIVSLGEADFQGGDKLAEVSFSSFFANYFDYTFMTELPFYSPEEYIKRLNWIRVSHNPVQLVIDNTGINYTVKIRSLDIEYRGGEPDDIHYSISFKKHRAIEVRKVDNPDPSYNPVAEIVSSSGSDSGDRPQPDPPQYFTVTDPKESLWNIAQKVWGDGSRWQEIADFNWTVLGMGPQYQLELGMVLAIPGTGSSTPNSTIYSNGPEVQDQQYLMDMEARKTYIGAPDKPGPF